MNINRPGRCGVGSFNGPTKIKHVKSNPSRMIDNAFWRNRNVFVTGCTGMLGSWMVKRLIEADANVVGLIRDWVPRSKLIKDGSLNKITAVNGSLEEYQTLARTLNEYQIDTVFHLGAQTIVGVANNHPISTFEANIKGTWNILEACRQSPWIKRIVVASSDKAYGDQKVLPYTEGAPLHGQHPYDVSKSCADLMSQMYYKTYNVPVTITRCGNFYGGGDLNFNRIVPGTIQSIIRNERPLIRSDGKYIRDYFYIENGVEAYLLLAQKMEKLQLSGEAFNFSNEIQVTVLDLVNRIIKLMGSDLTPDIRNEAKNEILHQYLSAEKARRILQWKPSFDLDRSLLKTIEWYREYFKSL